MKIPGFKTPANWENYLTWEDILQMESQGSDVTEIKERFLIRQKKYEEIEKNREVLRFTTNPVDTVEKDVDFSRIKEADIKNPQSKLIRDTFGKPPLLGKSKWTKKVENARLLYVSVVQCNPNFWSQMSSVLPAVIVIAAVYDDKHRNDLSVVKKVSGFLNEFRDNENINDFDLSKSMKKLHKDLNNPKSFITAQLDDTVLSLIGLDSSAKVHVDTFTIFPSEQKRRFSRDRFSLEGILPSLQYREIGSQYTIIGASKFIPDNHYFI